MNVLVNDLDVHFQSQTFQVNSLTSIGRKIQPFVLLSGRSLVLTIVWRHCKCCTSGLLPTFSRSQNLKCEYLENGES